MSKTKIFIASAFVVIAAALINVQLVNTSSAYTAQNAGDRANDVCSRLDRTMVDTVWVSGPGGSATIEAQQGVTSVPVEVHVAGRYCLDPQDYTRRVTGVNPNGQGRASNINTVNNALSGVSNITYPHSSTTTGSTFGGKPGWFHRVTTGTLYIGNSSGNTRFQSIFTTEVVSGNLGSTFRSPNTEFDLNIVRTSAWTIQGESYLGLQGQSLARGNIDVRPGQSIEFKHDLRVRDGNLDRTVTSVVRGTGSGYAAFNGAIEPPLVSAGTTTRQYTNPVQPTNTLIVRHGTEPGYNPSWMIYTVRQDDVGRSLCQRIEWLPAANNNNGATATPFRCANVPYNYALTPTVSINPNGIIEAGTPYTVTPTIANAGPTKSRAADWQLNKIILTPNQAIPAGGTSTTAPCTFFSGTNCQRLSNGNSEFMPGTVNVGDYSGADEVSVGSKICFALSVNNYRHDASGWRHSNLVCLTIGKKPKVNVLGGDLVVGRGSESNPSQVSSVRTSVSRTAAGTYYGSWAEYGITPSGLVTGMASAAGYSNGSSTDSLCALSLLTFANAGASGSCNDSTVGGYQHASVAPSIASRFPVTSTTPNLGGTANLSSIGTSGLYTTTSPTLAIIGGSQIQAGRWVVIHAPNATVTIGGDITYTNAPLNSIQDIPQVVIIARNIIISDEVGRIDAWLVANGSGTDGRINTCGAGTVNESTTLTSQICDDQLTVNGPVSANHLIMRRTAGSGPGEAAGDPAEVFNLRADAYIWASNYTPGTGRIQTVMTTELPPRF